MTNSLYKNNSERLDLNFVIIHQLLGFGKLLFRLRLPDLEVPKIMKRLFSSRSTEASCAKHSKIPGENNPEDTFSTISKYISECTKSVKAIFSSEPADTQPKIDLTQKILEEIASIEVQPGLHNLKNQEKLKEIVSAYVKFPGLIPKASTTTGSALLQNGIDIHPAYILMINWMEIYKDNPVINFPRIIEKAQVLLFPSITTNKQLADQFIKKYTQTQNSQSSSPQIQGQVAISETLILNRIEQHAVQIAAKQEPFNCSTSNESKVSKTAVETATDASNQCGIPMLGPLKPTRITGIVQYDFKDLGLYGVLLIKKDDSSDQFLAGICLNNQRHNPKTLKQLACQYQLKGFVSNEQRINDLREYWATHLDSFFQNEATQESR